MADTVADTKETTAVGTPEKKDVEKKVDVEDEDSKASGNEDRDKLKEKASGKGERDKLKENGTADERDSAEDSQDKEVESAEYGDSTDSVEVSATKRKSEGGDTPESTPVEGLSPEKKAKLEEKAAEADAKAPNGERVAVA